MDQFKLFYPLKPYTINQKFGENKNSFYKEMGMKGHNGIDLQAQDGQLIYASHDGEVTFTGEDGAGGLGVVIRTDKEYLDLNAEPYYFKTIYWHCQKGSFLVKPTQKVKAGTPIAKADNTGKSTGTHLHWGLKKVQKGETDWQWFNTDQDNGYLGATDPQPYCVGYFAEDADKVTAILNSLKLALESVVNIFKGLKK